MEVSTPQRTIQADEADVILPPPTALNPVPTLPAALRVDNREQLVELLLENPHASDSPFRQLLVFGDDSLRTLLLRQVLSDPHTRTFKAKKKNWDAHDSFPLPKSLQSNVVGTRLLSTTFGPNAIKTKTKTTLEGAEVSLKEDDDEDDSGNSFNAEKFHVDVISYFLRPWELAQTQLVIKRIQGWKKRETRHRIVYLPQTTALVHQMLSDRGIASNPNVSIKSLQLDVFPLETDVLSLEYAEALKDEVEGTPSLLVSTVARSILKLQDVVGTIPRIQALGNLGEEIVKKVLDQSVDEFLAAEEDAEDAEPKPVPEGESDVAAMLIIDRKIDMVTPMITPLTYEGLLDEIVGIDTGFVKVNVDTINPDDDDDKAEEKKRKSDGLVMLGVNAGDSLYAEVRDQHVEKFGSFLQNQAMALRESHANFTNKGTKKDLSEIHQFVKQIPIFTQNLRSLTNHIHLAELVKHYTEQISFREQWQTERSIIEGELCYDMLEDWIASGYPPYKLLRLLCLQSICSGGLKSSRYETFRTQVVQVYGYEFLFVLHDLEKLGLIKRRETLWMDKTSPWSNLRKSLILINAEVDTIEPDDVSYVSSGYAPLSVRLVQSAIQGWTGKDDILKDIPGRLIDVSQFKPPQDLSGSSRKPPVGSLGTLARNLTPSSKKPTLIVYYVGGVTLTEIAALRFLSKRPTFPYHIVCVTTKVMNGSTFLQTLG